MAVAPVFPQGHILSFQSVEITFSWPPHLTLCAVMVTCDVKRKKCTAAGNITAWRTMPFGSLKGLWVSNSKISNRHLAQHALKLDRVCLDPWHCPLLERAVRLLPGGWKYLHRQTPAVKVGGDVFHSQRLQQVFGKTAKQTAWLGSWRTHTQICNETGDSGKHVPRYKHTLVI